MGKKINIISFFVISVLGTVMHFIYEITNKNKIAGLISPINESIWEHQKLLFFPSLIVLAVVYFTMNEKPKNYIQAMTLGIISGILTVVTIFYLYSGALGFSLTWVDITIYYIGVFVTILVANTVIKNGFLEKYRSLCLILIVVISLLFFIFTFYPPKISLFIPKPE